MIKIGLALGAGGARGLIHIGILKVLIENKIPINFIAGSSIGALIGGFYCAGFSIDKIEEIAIDTDWKDLFSLFFDPDFKSGLISGEKIKNFLEYYLGDKKIENCLIPFRAIATDLSSGDYYVIDKGKLSTAIRASISIPFIFAPVKINNKMLVDGGISLPVPVDVVRKMGADFVIAVNLSNYNFSLKGHYNILEVADYSLKILEYNLAKFNVKNADFVINVNLPYEVKWYDFLNAQEKIKIGENIGRKYLPLLSNKLIKFLV